MWTEGSKNYKHGWDLDKILKESKQQQSKDLIIQTQEKSWEFMLNVQQNLESHKLSIFDQFYTKFAINSHKKNAGTCWFTESSAIAES